jgi:hypothetical protein
MSIRYSVILAALAVMSVPAVAGPKPQATTLNAPGMATVDGMLGYCRRVNAISVAQYTQEINSLTQGHPKEELIDIRASKKYRDTLANINSQLLKVPIAAGVSACRAGK